ncbi:hypothetical protein [Bacillus sp. Marseille-Q3570]|uniref:hypothetical protein n=1 Tax=Bacillus sp. Marseille-Q3570 TaxID=2963522 RepID=UPI0021B72639|nr:hypothetical protein [Bacillus sp. Marseille-Q3570]
MSSLKNIPLPTISCPATERSTARCNRPFKSKNDLAAEMIQGFPSSEEEQVYLLIDSLYTSRKLVTTEARCSAASRVCLSKRDRNHTTEKGVGNLKADRVKNHVHPKHYPFAFLVLELKNTRLKTLIV